MGGFFGVTAKTDCIETVFYGTDYHSHLGTRRGGIASFDKEVGLQREIHNIQNSPFRTKFEHVFEEMSGTSAIGCISDTDPQPLLIKTRFGTFALATIGIINNADELIAKYLDNMGGHFDAMTGGAVNTTELVAALIGVKESLVDGIRFAQEAIVGTCSMLLLRDDGCIIAVRDRDGRLPVQIGKGEEGYAVSFESFPLVKTGFIPEYYLGAGEIVKISPDGYTQVAPPLGKQKICAFLWSYYGYATSTYQDRNVEVMRQRNGEIMCQNDKELGFDAHLDYVCGIPDSGTPHAIGYARQAGVPYARPLIKYTPTWARSFMPPKQSDRNKIAKMKQVPIRALIKDKDLLFVDDSIVRGTQLRETVEQLYELGAKSVHMRSACPPLMHGCKYLNFSASRSEMELIARQTIVELEGEEGFEFIDEYVDSKTERGQKLRKHISDKFGFSSLDFQSLDGIVESIGLPECELCTYCWSGKE